MNTVAMTTELQVLAWSVILCFVHIVLQATTATMNFGIGYNLSPRDTAKEPRGLVASRLGRALKNYLETYPIFVALALALAVTGNTGGIGATGALVWIVARVIYLPVYASGIPGVRTLLWVISMVGLVMMLARLMG
jgi:uncharacterized MAPEG superfamily protein